MDNTGEIRNRMVSSFIVICIAMIAVSGAFLTQNYLNLTMPGSVLAGLVIFFLLFLLHRQQLLRREIKDLKYNMGGPSDIEDGLIRRIDELSRQFASSSNPANGQELEDIAKSCAANSASILQIENEVSTVSGRIHQILAQNSADQDDENNSAPESKIIPLRNNKEPVVLSTGRAKRTNLSTVSEFSGPDLTDNSAPETIITPENTTTDLAEHSRNRTLTERLRNAVELGEMELHLQPIISLGNREPEFYEATLRLKELDGSYLNQQRLNRIASTGKLAVTLDNHLVFSAIRILRTLNELQKRTGLFCPVSASTLNNADAFEEIHSFLTANITLAGSLVLEIEQSALEELNSESRERLARLVDLGFSLLLNNISDFEFDGTLLHSAGFRNIKVSVDELLKMSDDGNIDENVTDFAEEMESCGLAVIVCEIEHEAQVMHLIDFDLPLGQGSLFSPSRPVKPELLNGADHDDRESGASIA